jgi:hypothetical protein
MADRTKIIPLYDDNIQNIENGFEFIGWLNLVQNHMQHKK